LNEIRPSHRREEIAILRAQILGVLLYSDRRRGELRAAIEELSQRRVRPPGSRVTRTYSVATLERWLYAYRAGGLDALMPQQRSDTGRGRKLKPELVTLISDIRREYPHASASLIRETLVSAGRLEPAKASETTLRRILRQQGLVRISRKGARTGASGRLRWSAAQPNMVSHADVCHGPSLTTPSGKEPLRIHALPDDASRTVLAIWACNTEQEIDMLRLLYTALVRHGTCDTLYLDNGATYRGDDLATVCARLGIALVHAEPYDPQARGKMERFWRTLRERCLDHLDTHATLHDVNVRLMAFVDHVYHRRAHASLLGKSPLQVMAERTRPDVRKTTAELARAFAHREERFVRGDGTLSFRGTNFEVDTSALRRVRVTVVYYPFDDAKPPWVEHGEQRYALGLVDAVANSKRARASRPRIPPNP
jgi:transposase InsO family protein